jgi:hypothetical protein
MASATFSTPHDPNGLVVSSKDLFGDTVTIVSGQNLAAGAVVGQITTGGKYMLSASAAADGSQTPVGVLAAAVNASAGDQPGYVYFTGDFNAAECVFGAGHTAASIRRTAAQRGLKFHIPQA